MFSLLGGIFLGWSLGANHAANCFGSAVASRMVRFWTAAVLCAVFVFIGALLEGHAGIETLSGLTIFDLEQAVAITVGVALTVTGMTWLNLPVSTSQGVVGAILGIGFINQQLNLVSLEKVVICWFATPFCALATACILYKALGFIYNRLRISIIKADVLLRIGLIVAGSYAAYSLGANNVANATAVFVGAGMLTVFQATLIGGLSIAFGVLTYSRGVMETVGRKLVRLDPFSALIVVLAEALTVHVNAVVGVPISTTQAVIGSVLGVGLIKGAKTINRKMLLNIFTGWFLTPTIACFMAMSIHFVLHLKYIPH
jgi:inorganic phosphate transporter, PiT family